VPKLNEKIAKQARIACEKWRGYFKQNIDQYHEMHTFVLGQQWTDDEQDDMVKTFRKTPLTSNKLATMSNSLLGEQQQNTPQLEVVPMTNCDDEVASIRELITKDIMFSGGASLAYQVSASQAAIGGFGAFYISTEYIHSKSFDLDIVYHYFKDATRCYWDSGAESINKTDGSHCGFVSRMTRAKFRETYGEEVEEDIGKTSITASEEEVALAVQPNESEDPFNWSDSESITIIDHFVREGGRDKLYKLSNGVSLNQDELDELIDKSIEINAFQQSSSLMNESYGESPEVSSEYEEMDIHDGVEGAEDDLSTIQLWMDGEVVRIEGSKEYIKYKVMHYKIAGNYVLDKTEFPSEQLPLVFVDNNSYYEKSGKQICRSFFGDAKDTQRYINYLRTQSAHILKISRYDQWIGSKKNVSSNDTARNWRDPNNIQGMLTYDESPTGAKPEQLRPPELSASLFQQYQLAIEDLYTSTGLYPARMGNNGDEASGRAIDARTRQGSYSTYVFRNSINRATATGGEIVNEMIPRVYDTERVLALMTPDEEKERIKLGLNQGQVMRDKKNRLCSL